MSCFAMEEQPSTNLHLPQIVCLLKSVGFNIRRIDSIPPEGLTPLENKELGTRVIISCGHSGQRCFLELPEEPEKCRCLNKSENSQDQFWEVTGKGNDIVETGSDIIPVIPKLLNIYLKNSMDYLGSLIKSSPRKVDLNQHFSDLSSRRTSVSSSPKENAKRLSGFINELIAPTITINPISNLDTSLTCNRSLDSIPRTSILKNAEQPLSPVLQATLGVTQSSPNIPFTFAQEIGSTAETKAQIIKLLETALFLLTLDNKVLKPKQVTFEVEKSELVPSSELPKKEESSPVTSKNKLPMKNVPLPEATKVGKLSARATPIKTPKKPEPKTNEEKPTGSGTKSRRASFSHVKSTIPKPHAGTKLVKKN